MPHCEILSGLPGSGKSHYAKAKADERFIVCSADQFFEIEGEYKFDKTKLGQAHKFCFLKFIHAIEDEYEENFNVIVDNTNTSILEIAPYYRVADAFGYETTVVCINTPFEVAYARQTHNVPRGTMEKMQESLQRLKAEMPWYWNRKEIS